MRIAAAMPRRGAAIVRGEADPEAANPQALLIMADSVEASLLSFLNACVGAAFNLNRAEAASVVSIVFAGETVGALVAGPLSDKTGRKGISLASAFGVAVFGFGSAFAQSYAAFVTLRLLVGVFIGTFAVPFDLLAEQLPASIRGRALMWVQVGWSIGAMYCCAAAWVTLPIWSWRSLTLACAIPPMIIFLALVYFLDESPRWFLEVGRRKDAAEVFRRIAVKNGRGDDPKVMEAIAEIERDDDDVAKEESSLQLFHDAWTQYKALWDAKRRCTTAAVWAVWFGFGLAYYGVTLLVTRIYDYADDDDDFKCKFRYWQIFVVFSAEFVGTVALVPFIDSVGRVRSAFATYALTAICLVPVALGATANAVATQRFVFGCLYVALGSITAASSITWVHITELYPTEVRSTGHTAAFVVARVGAFLSGYVVDNGASILEATFVLILSTAVCAIGTATLEETRGKRLE
mmetsp:Transcript_4329/g.13050  ORF Transcript_4329/g.13050 Transcript_4329/m.13050 type:complete len:463 (+) Transcript_4329:1924-3312(+)